MKILLTGHTGFVGSRLNSVLNRTGHKVYGINSSFPIWDKNELYTCIKSVSPNLIIHCGAISDIKKCEEQPEQANKINYTGSKNLAELSAENGIHLIYFSSDQVYNKFDLKRRTEKTIPNPQNYYAKLKLMAEKDITENLKSYHILRAAWQYTCFDSISYKGRGGFLGNLYHAYRDGVEFAASVNSYRNIAFVYDTVDVVCQAVDGKIPCGIYNVSSENYNNIFETAKVSAKILGLGNTDFIIPHIDDVPFHLCADPAALKLAGYQMHDFEESLYYCCKLFKG